MTGVVEPPQPSPGRPVRLWPWLIGCGMLAFLLWRTPFERLAEAFERGPSLGLVAYTALAILVAFVADVGATSVALGAVGVRLPARDLVVVRGTSHLLGLLNFTVGQGTVAFYLVRLGTPVARAGGVVLFMVVVSYLGLAVLGLLGLSLAWTSAGRWGLWLLAAGVAAVGGSIAMLVVRPPWLTRIGWARPLFDVTLGGHLRALGSRLAHFVLFALLYWGAVRIWGIAVPLREALALVAVVMFVAAIPITPHGLGTVQAAQILLFGRYLPDLEPAAREASVLAFSLVHYTASMATQALLGFVCYLGWRRLSRRPPTTPRHPTPAG